MTRVEALERAVAEMMGAYGNAKGVAESLLIAGEFPKYTKKAAGVQLVQADAAYRHAVSLLEGETECGEWVER